MANVSLNRISKAFEKNVVVKDFNLEIEDKEFIVLVGPSGCGKSTTLRMIAGLEEITDGELYIDGRLVNDVPPKSRDIAMVFQNYALYPHMTVYENMAFALKLRKYPKHEIEERVRQAAKILDIEAFLLRKPKQLSGGQRQRVAIGRAIVRNPKVFLMDEPLSNLDAKLRNQMRAELIHLQKTLQATFVYVTHDQVEAMTLGSRIVVMEDGVIQQVGTPHQIFETPANMFVAGFIGTPQMNFFKSARLILEGGQYCCEIFGKRMPLSDEKQDILHALKQEPCEVIAGVRPEDIEVTQDGPQSLHAEIDVSELMGSEVYIHVNLPAEQGENPSAVSEPVKAVLRVKSYTVPESARQISMLPSASKIHLFDADTKCNLLYPETGGKASLACNAI